MARRTNPLRVFGLWLLYAVVGIFMLAALSSHGDFSPGDSGSSPTRLRSKLVGGLSGVGLVLGSLGSYLMSDASVGTEASYQLAIVGWLLAGGCTLIAWRMIAQDLGAQTNE